MNNYQTPKPPLPEPMDGLTVGTFAHNTVTKRFPKIARETIQDNDFPPYIAGQLAQLIDDIPYAPLRNINDPAAPDAQDWQDYLRPHLGKNWLEIPWFFAEMYFYRRILEATGFHQPGAWRGYDPFQKQKERVLASASESTSILAELLETSKKENAGINAQDSFLQQLLVLNVWGNQADLSMWSAGETRPDHRASDDQMSHLLANDAGQVSDYLLTSSIQLNRVDFILDNYGPELIHDIGLADYLLDTELVSVVRFHAKPTPHYVSDAMIVDIYSTLEYLSNHEEKVVRQLAERVHGYIRNRQLEIMDDYYWTSPIYFWEMPQNIRGQLDDSDLVISKGDANYRRRSGDLDWPPTTPFQDVVRYFPSPLLALRVLKAELALGIPPSRVNELDHQDPDWKFNGHWAVIQFFQR
jgi:uncharacterized protein with ATP-grasp and redox domains